MDHAGAPLLRRRHPPAATPPAGGGHAMTAAGDTATNPQTVGGLLAEEQTMVPPAPTSANSSSFSSALPSFLEANLVDATQASGRRALRQCLQAVTSRAEAAASAVATDGSCCWRERLASLVARAGMNYSPEIVLLSTYLAERHLLDTVSATVAEAAYGMRRARARLVPGGGIGESLGAGATDGSGSGSGSMALAPLTSADKVRSALFAALLPYLMERMDDPRHHERRDGGPGDGGDHQHHRDEDSSASASSALGQACGGRGYGSGPFSAFFGPTYISLARGQLSRTSSGTSLECRPTTLPFTTSLALLYGG